MPDEPKACRICFESSEDPSDLIAPCRCTGSQQWVHAACLRTWQRTVQLGTNRPEEALKDTRHATCQVCGAAFDLKPPDRAEMLSSLAQVEPSAIQPGLLLVTSRSRRPATDSLPFFVQVFLEAKIAHFRESVYLITDVVAGGATDGSDQVVGVNLSRPMQELREESLSPQARAQVAAAREAGTELVWFNGGPVGPTHATGLVRNGGADDAGLFAALGPFASGPLEAVLDPAPPKALGFTGQAKWSRTQLLGELARGSWGWCEAVAGDVGAAGPGLWSQLVDSDRLAWAPANELSEQHRQALGAASDEGRQSPAERENVALQVQRFELLRREARPEETT